MESTKHPLNSTTLGTPSGELVLGITGNSAQSETVRVRTAKCSVGSADACSIRLNGAGIQPVHCIILRGAKKTIVRRWADGVWLNSKAFTDATLNVGDVITISNVRMEVLSDERVSSSGDLHQQVATAESKVEELSEQARLLNMRIRELEGRSSSKFSEGAQDDLLLRLARLQDEKQELERRIAAQSVRHLDERRQWSCDLERLQAQVAKVDEFKLDKNAIRAEEEALRTEIESLRNQIQQQQADFDAQRADWQRQAAAAAEDATTASDDLSRRLAELESRQSQFEDEARSFREEQTETRQELEQRSRELDAAADELAEQSKRLDEQANALDEQAAGLDARAEAFKAEEEVASSVDRSEISDLEALDEIGTAGGEFNFPSQLKLEDTDDWQGDSEADSSSTEQDEPHVELESTANTAEKPLETDSESEQDESFERLHAEVSSLIDDDEFSPASESESDELANDDLMDYASQVASEVRGQVIDQQADPEEQARDEESFVDDDLTYSDAPFVDSSELYDELDEPVATESQNEIRPTDDGSTPFAAADDVEDAEVSAARQPSPFHAEFDETATASPFGEPAETDSLRFFSEDLMRANSEQQSTDSTPFDPSELSNALDSIEASPSFDAPAESVDAAEQEVIVDAVESNDGSSVAPLNSDDEPEHQDSTDDVADEMLSRLQAMVGADATETPLLDTEPLGVSGESAFENRLDADAESLLSELQSFGSADSDTTTDPSAEELMTPADESAVAAKDDAMLAELMELSSQEAEPSDGPITADEVQYESVEPADADRLETASLREKYQIDDSDCVDAVDEVAPTIAPVVEQPAADGDSSIEDYMQQLMQRVGNGPQAVAAPAPKDPSPEEVAEEAALEAAEEVEKAKPVRTPSRPSLPADSLTKMRELANESARSAIKSHADTSSRANAFTNLCFLGISLLAAAIFFVLSEGTSLIWLLPGLIASGAAILFGYRAVKGAVNERAAGSGPRPKNTESPSNAVPAGTGLNEGLNAPVAPTLEPTFNQRAVDHNPQQNEQLQDPSASQYPSLLAHQPQAQQPQVGQPQFAQPEFGQPQAPVDPSQIAQPGYAMPGYDQQQQHYGTDPQVAGQQPQYPQAGYAMPQQPGQPAYDQAGQPIPQTGFPGTAPYPQAQQHVGFGQPAPGADPNAAATGYPQPAAPQAYDPNTPVALNAQDPLAAFGAQAAQPPQNFPG